jgi:hypothetical protein
MNYELGRRGKGAGRREKGEKSCLLPPNPMFDKDKQKLSIDSKSLRIFKLTFRNIYKFLKIN